jgi:hypothetical protein
MSQAKYMLEIEDFEGEKKGISTMSVENYGFRPLDHLRDGACIFYNEDGGKKLFIARQTDRYSHFFAQYAQENYDNRILTDSEIIFPTASLSIYFYRIKDKTTDIYVWDFEDVYVSGYCPGGSIEKVQLHYKNSDSYTTAVAGNVTGGNVTMRLDK